MEQGRGERETRGGEEIPSPFLGFGEGETELIGGEFKGLARGEVVGEASGEVMGEARGEEERVGRHISSPIRPLPAL